MTKASKESYIKVISSGKVAKAKDRIYEYISKNPNTHIVNMKRDLRISHQTLTARLSELQDEGVIDVQETKRAPNGSHKLSRFHIQKDVDKIEKNRQDRLLEKRDAIKKRAKIIADKLGCSMMELFSA